MAKKRRTRAKGGWRKDPFAPINCDYLRAVMLREGVSVAELSRRTRDSRGEIQDSEQTLAHLVNGVGVRRCRKARLGRIAKALGMPDGLLSGQPIFLPDIPLLPGRPYEFLHTLRTELAASRLLTEAANACKRDMDDPMLNRPEESTGTPPWLVYAQILQQLAEFVQIGEWRKRLLEWDKKVHEERGYSEPLTRNAWTRSPNEPLHVPYDPQHEAAVLALAQAFEHILRPWFDGDARLNYRALRDLVHLPGHPFAGLKEIPSAFNPHAVMQAHAPAPHTNGDRV